MRCTMTDYRCARIVNYVAGIMSFVKFLATTSAVGRVPPNNNYLLSSVLDLLCRIRQSVRSAGANQFPSLNFAARISATLETQAPPLTCAGLFHSPIPTTNELFQRRPDQSPRHKIVRLPWASAACAAVV